MSINININSYRSKLTLLFLLFLSVALPGIAQDESVVITEPGITRAPDNSAILEVYSNKKGVLFPRMSSEAMYNMEEPADGLIVFVTETEFKGYWLYNATDAKWNKLRNSGTEKMDITGPVGTIIMYALEPNSTLFSPDGEGLEELSNWHICNGFGDTPDLRGRFVMSATYGSTDPKQKVAYSSTDATNSLVISKQQMHPHDHGFERPIGSIGEHEHQVLEFPHFHTIKVNNSAGGAKYKEIKRRAHGTARTAYTETGSKSLDEWITIKNSTEELTIEYGENVQETGGGASIENRPPYYVMVYIMKVE
jgi:hypothetical protein